MRRFMPLLLITLFAFASAAFPLFIACGDEESDADSNEDDDDDEDKDDEGGESLFVSGVIAEIDGDPNYRAERMFKLPRKNANEFHVLMAARDGSDMYIEKHTVSGLTGDGKALSKSASISARLSDYGLEGYRIASYDRDDCGNEYMLVNDPNGEKNAWFVPLTGKKSDMVELDSYTNVYMWVRECNRYKRIQIFGFSRGTVVTGQNVSREVWKAELWDWRSARETPWVRIPTVADDLPEGKNFLNNSEIAFFSGFYHDYDWGSAMALIADDGSLHWMRTSMTENPEDIRWQENTNVFHSFNNRGFVASYIDIEDPRNLWLVDHVNDRQDDVQPKHICVVGHEKDSDTPLLWSASGGDFLFRDEEKFEIGFEGPCSVTSFNKAINAYAIASYPWIAYRSAKNELSALWQSQTDGGWHHEVIDSIPQESWNFASQHLTMGTLDSTGGNRVSVAYDNNESIKVAICRKNGPCGDK